MHLFPDTKEFAAHDVLYSDLTKMPWVAEGQGGKIGKIDAATGKVTEYDVPLHRIGRFPSQVLRNLFTL